MSDSFTLDQLRTFIAVYEAGNFTAAARKLGRVQSAVSGTMSTLEEQLGVTLWDRTTRIATLTDQGKAMLASAKRVIAEADALKRSAIELIDGVEPKVSLCVDSIFPVAALVKTSVAFAKEFPSVDLHIDTESMSVVSERVLRGSATMGVVGPLGMLPALERRALTPVRMIPVVAAKHPLAKRKGRIEIRAFADYVQIVLAERSVDGVADQAVLSPRTWRITDLHTKRELILGGAGWGNLPRHLIHQDLARKRLVEIRPAAWGDDEHTLPLSVIFRRETVFGPAHRWLLATLERACKEECRK